MKSNDPDAIPLGGAALLLLVCLVWGGNMVSIKISNEGLPPLLAGTLRSVVAAGLLACFAGRRVILRGADRWHGMVIGALFGIDFLFLYAGTLFTTASRAVIFLYTHPFWVAIGAHFIIAGDRLTARKSAGLLTAFAGLVAVFGAGEVAGHPRHLLGDAMEVGAALSWAATTVYIKKAMAGRGIGHLQTLFAQLAWSVPVLALGWALLEGPKAVSLTPAVAAAFAYQTIVVAFASYLLWFWMIHRYPVSRLSAFTFNAPIAGVVLSGIVLGEPLPPALLAGLALVAAGIFLVNSGNRARAA